MVARLLASMKVEGSITAWSIFHMVVLKPGGYSQVQKIELILKNQYWNWYLRHFNIAYCARFAGGVRALTKLGNRYLVLGALPYLK